MALKPTAFLIHQNELHFTESTLIPISDLIESIWLTDPDRARSITRNRIFHFSKASPACAGMIKVAAKRSSQLPFVEFEKCFEEALVDRGLIRHQRKMILRDPPITLPQKCDSIHSAMDLALKLADHSTSKIGALLLNSEKEVISWGWNQHHENRVMHAELMLIHHHMIKHGKSVPAHSTLITTLQPCAMCAGYLHAHSDDFNSLKIIYLKEDQGPFAQNSILMKGSDLFLKSGLIDTPFMKKL
jgi:tRNA(Arg) A34 adenosine deaminase TadA